jgi:proline iminopeptidase
MNRSCLLLLVCACHVGSPSPSRRFDEDHLEAINGTKLHYRVRGWDKAHPYLVLLHGGPGGSALEFYPWGEALERELNVVYLDQRGSGLSERARFAGAAPTPVEAAPFALANQVADVEGVRERLGVERWYVLGHSFGGMLGVEVTVAAPDHVIAYIHMCGLISVPMINEDWLAYAERAVTETARLDPKESARAADVLASVAALRAMTPEQRERELEERVINKLMPERVRDRFQAANLYDARIDREVLQRYHLSPELFYSPEPGRALAVAEHFATRDVLDSLARIRVPTLILSATRDPQIPPARARMAAALIPGAQLLLIDDAGHELYKDQPVKSAEAVLTFVRGHR